MITEENGFSQVGQYGSALVPLAVGPLSTPQYPFCYLALALALSLNDPPVGVRARTQCV